MKMILYYFILALFNWRGESELAIIPLENGRTRGGCDETIHHLTSVADRKILTTQSLLYGKSSKNRMKATNTSINSQMGGPNNARLALV